MSSKQQSKAARRGFYFALIAVLIAAFSAVGYRMEILSVLPSLLIFLVAGFFAFMATIVSLIGLWKTRPSSELSGLGLAFSGAVMGLFIFSLVGNQIYIGSTVPAIHDITTDVQNPPQFKALLAVRKASPNGAVYAGQSAAQEQEQAYVDIKPLMVKTTPAQTYDKALATAKKLGWKIAAANENDKTIEATDTTFWFGFKDDVVIRITPTADGSRVDIRSMSRVGEGDLGKNAQRIRAFFARMNVD